MTAREFAQLVHAKRMRRGKFIALCPAHGDHKPSLQISEGKQGVLLKCWSHDCSPREICAALGMKVSDLFYEARQLTPEVKQRLKDEEKLEWLTRISLLALIQKHAEPERKDHWDGVSDRCGKAAERLRKKLCVTT